MILGLGNDVAHLPRFVALLKTRHSARIDRLAARILHPTHEAPKFHGLLKATTSDADSDARVHAAARFLATAWATKEALYKTLDAVDQARCRFSHWHKAAVPPVVAPTAHNSDRFRKPAIVNEKYARTHTQERFHLSISHDGDYVFATVIREQVTG